MTPTARSALRCKPPAETTGVGAFRVGVGGIGRSYTVMDVPSLSSIGQLMRQAEATGALRPSCDLGGPCGCYAVLDLYDDDDGIIADFCIPTARGFRWWYRKVGWRVVNVEAEVTRWQANRSR